MKPMTMANRRGHPRMQRRYSLPATPTVVESTRQVPKGSDTFKKALQELTATEPHHAPSKLGTQTRGLFGLNNIQEGNESDYTDTEDAAPSPADMLTSQPTYVVDYPTNVERSRRHSSPSCLTSNEDRTDGKMNEIKDMKSDSKVSILQTLTQQRKEYFVKHGRFPVGGSAKGARRPASTQDRQRKSDIAFGTSLHTKVSNIHI